MRFGLADNKHTAPYAIHHTHNNGNQRHDKPQVNHTNRLALGPIILPVLHHIARGDVACDNHLRLSGHNELSISVLRNRLSWPIWVNYIGSCT